MLILVLTMGYTSETNEQYPGDCMYALHSTPPGNWFAHALRIRGGLLVANVGSGRMFGDMASAFLRVAQQPPEKATVHEEDPVHGRHRASRMPSCTRAPVDNQPHRYRECKGDKIFLQTNIFAEG